jgi:hypothetical protein
MAMPATMPTPPATMPAMPVSAAMSVPATAMARAELIGDVRHAVRLNLERSPDIVLRGLCGRHRRTERKSRREYDSDRSHFLVLLFAGMKSRTADVTRAMRRGCALAS